jgi:hypothetical protein
MASAKHKTHVSGQASFGKHALTGQLNGPFGGSRSSSERIHDDYVRFTLCIPSAEERQRLLGVSAYVEGAWSDGRNLRSLRKHKKTVARLVREHEAQPIAVDP